MNQERFLKLNKKEKKEFLSNDMAERIMRVEQRVSARFEKVVNYKNTKYYKSMTPAQKTSFDRYLKNKGKKKVLISFIFLIPLAIIFLLNINFTGNVINENYGKYNFLDYILVGIFFILLIIFIISLKYRNSRSRKMDNHTKIIENLLTKNAYQTAK